MPPVFTVRVRYLSHRDKQKYLFSRAMSWTDAKVELAKLRAYGHRADIVEITPRIAAVIERHTL